MTDGYYDSWPKRVPEIPISVVGFVGQEHELVASMLSRLSGLPLHRISHLVEHVEGKDSSRILREHGVEHFRLQETQALLRALREQPPGIIALGDGTLLDPTNCREVLARSVLVYIRYDRASIEGHLEERRETQGHCEPWIADAFDVDQSAALDRLFEERKAGYEASHLQIEGSGRTAAQVARDLGELLHL